MFAFNAAAGAAQRVLWSRALPQLPKPADPWGCVGAGIYETAAVAGGAARKQGAGGGGGGRRGAPPHP